MLYFLLPVELRGDVFGLHGDLHIHCSKTKFYISTNTWSSAANMTICNNSHNNNNYYY